MSLAFDHAASDADLLALGVRARDAARALASLSGDQRTAAIMAMADLMEGNAAAIVAANARDVDAAKASGQTAAFVDRLTFGEERVAATAEGVRAVAHQDDPVGRELARWSRPSGLDIARVATPLGVVGVIYESRPNVTADAAALCVRSGNAVILRSGSAAFGTARAIHRSVCEGLVAAGAPEDAVAFIPTTDRAAVGAMLAGLGGSVDVIVPRGGPDLVARVQADARVPVFAHLAGVNHVYLHESADIAMAVDVVVNAKMRRTGICGAAETLLVDAAGAARVLPAVAVSLTKAGCALRGDERARGFVAGMAAAAPEDWDAEYLDAVLSVAVVEDMDAAMAHIARHGTGHTEAIVADDQAAAERFLAGVDSAIVLHNASTQFADGGEFGMGAEIGIATGRLHARGPVGADQLTTFKYVVRANGATRP